MPQFHLRFLLYLVYAALALGALVIFLPGALPFLLALALAFLLEWPVRLLTERLNMPRGWAAGLVVSIFTLLLLGSLCLLVRRLWYELNLLTGHLPALWDWLRPLQNRGEALLYRLSVALSPAARQTLDAALHSALAQLQAFFSTLSGKLLSWMAGSLSALPVLILFLFTFLLATYFFLAGRPGLLAWGKTRLPERWLQRWEYAATQLKCAWGGWLRAQGILMGVTFFLLAVGFLLMRVQAAILLAAGVALLDALPLFGTGTVLFPWAVVLALSGNLRRCIALLALYIVTWFLRSLLEPKLIADRAGLHPLVALFAMYMGFSLFGIVGMLLAPLVAVALGQFFHPEPTD